MKKVTEFFTINSQNETYVVQTKAKALVGLTLITFGIILIKISTNYFLTENDEASFANYGVPGMLAGVAFINLFILRLSTYQVAGMFFSSGLILTLLAGILMSANTIHPMNSYLSGLYIVLAVLALSALFGSKKSLVVNSIITVFCVNYLYNISSEFYVGEYAVLAKTGLINYHIALIAMVLILFFIMKISESAQNKTLEMMTETNEKNEEIEMHFSALQKERTNLQAAISDTNFVIGEAVDSGNFNARIDLNNKEGEWLSLSQSINKLFETVTIPFTEINQIVNKMAEGDLTGRYVADAKGEVLTLKENLNSALGNLGILLKDISDSVKAIGDSSDEMMFTSNEMIAATDEISSSVVEMSRGAMSQVEKADDTSTIIEGVSNFSNEIGVQADSINRTAKDGVMKGISGIQQVDKVTETMKAILEYSNVTSESISSLSKRSEEISRVLSIIQDVASQTNLLALNAAIEAAQAGDAGRGFAVVAEEIRKLAEDSKNSTKEIEKLIEYVQSDTKQTAELMSKMSAQILEGEEASREGNQAFSAITESYKETLNLSQKIVEDTNEQASKIRDILTEVEAVVIIAEETAAGTEQSAAYSIELSKGMTDYADKTKGVKRIVSELQEKVDNFKLLKEVEVEEVIE
ncbi:MAG: methyl-accepting chemotaxis protein [Reichenbachiella sp.]